MISTFGHNRRKAAGKIDHTGLTGAKSYILASFDSHDRRDQANSTALMAAAASDPELFSVVREHFKNNFDQSCLISNLKNFRTLVKAGVLSFVHNRINEKSYETWFCHANIIHCEQLVFID